MTMTLRSLHILVALVTLVSCSPTGVNPIPRAGEHENPGQESSTQTGTDVIERCREAHSRCRTYQARFTFSFLRYAGATLWKGEGSLLQKRPFAFFCEVRGNAGLTEPVSRFHRVVWRTPRGDSHLYDSATAAVDAVPLTNALAIALNGLGEQLLFVPSMLLRSEPDHKDMPEQLLDTRLERTQSVGGVDCYVVSGVGGSREPTEEKHRVVTMWIGKEER